METTEEVRNLPQNIVRKMGGIKHCMIELDRFCMKYQPIFTDDPFFIDILDQMQAEFDQLKQALAEHPDYMKYVYDYWKE